MHFDDNLKHIVPVDMMKLEYRMKLYAFSYFAIFEESERVGNH